MLRLAASLLLAIAAVAHAAQAPLAPDQRAGMLAEFRAEVAALDQAIAQSPGDVTLYSRRGDRHLFLGEFTKAVVDFEKMIALDPEQDAPHWRLGIAYHFTGQLAKSAAQFAKYHSHDARDRENGIWKFLADAKLLGLEPARRSMLPYTRFDREPFPSLYEMFAGMKTTADLLAEMKTRQLDDNPRVMFFAHYYAGLNEQLLENRQQAVALLAKAVANQWGRTAENGPAYMWQVARLHYEVLESRPR